MQTNLVRLSSNDDLPIECKTKEQTEEIVIEQQKFFVFCRGLLVVTAFRKDTSGNQLRILRKSRICMQGSILSHCNNRILVNEFPINGKEIRMGVHLFHRVYNDNTILFKTLE